MFNIPKIEKESFYIDLAMNAMGQHAIKERVKIEERFEKNKRIPKSKDERKTPEEINLNKRKDLELAKIRFLNDNLNIKIKKIISSFPKLAKIDDIYLKLINTSQIKVEMIEDALKRLLWIANTIDEFTQNTEVKIKRTKSQQTLNFIMKKYLGRVNSLFRKNKEYFRRLDDARQFMNQLPKFENIYTVSIAGFPNVGKSTLMNKLSGSNVEIQNYPFTTKGLMFGYLKKNENKIIQMIDTPGLLGRSKMNEIEQRAQVVISQYCDMIIFVLDFTQGCGYHIESQLKLLRKTKGFEKPILIYLSKTDIFTKEDIELKEENKNTIKKYELFENFEKLKTYLFEKQSSSKKFDIRDIKKI